MNVIKNKRKMIYVGVLLLLLLAGVGIWAGSYLSSQHARQAHVAALGRQVMPFDLEQTTHVFQKMDDGGLQRVTAKDAENHEQIEEPVYQELSTLQRLDEQEYVSIFTGSYEENRLSKMIPRVFAFHLFGAIV